MRAIYGSAMKDVSEMRLQLKSQDELIGKNGKFRP